MLLRILHHTRYEYQSQVVVAQHMAHLRPLEIPGQTVHSHTLTIEPLPVLRKEMRDAFGNWRTFFSLQSPHDTLDVTANNQVETQTSLELEDSPPWEVVREQLQYIVQAPHQPSAEFSFPSPYIQRHENFTDFARVAFAPRRPFLEACHDLMQRIHAEFEYHAESTEVNTPALDALAQRKGVCQDFAHIMIACLRSLGLPARYMSGYLLTQPPPGKPRLIGADASHAWVSVPHATGWADFDPTNNRCGLQRPGEDYVTLATGRDFGDVSPLRGVIQGGGEHKLEIAVTVIPDAEFSALTQVDSPDTTQAAAQDLSE